MHHIQKYKARKRYMGWGKVCTIMQIDAFFSFWSRMLQTAITDKCRDPLNCETLRLKSLFPVRASTLHSEEYIGEILAASKQKLALQQV